MLMFGFGILIGGAIGATVMFTVTRLRYLRGQRRLETALKEYSRVSGQDARVVSNDEAIKILSENVS